MVVIILAEWLVYDIFNDDNDITVKDLLQGKQFFMHGQQEVLEKIVADIGAFSTLKVKIRKLEEEEEPCIEVNSSSALAAVVALHLGSFPTDKGRIHIKKTGGERACLHARY